MYSFVLEMGSLFCLLWVGRSGIFSAIPLQELGKPELFFCVLCYILTSAVQAITPRDCVLAVATQQLYQRETGKINAVLESKGTAADFF